MRFGMVGGGGIAGCFECGVRRITGLQNPPHRSPASPRRFQEMVVSVSVVGIYYWNLKDEEVHPTKEDHSVTSHRPMLHHGHHVEWFHFYQHPWNVDHNVLEVEAGEQVD